MASLAVVSTSQSRTRRSPDVGALVASLRKEHGKQAAAALYDLILEDEALARAVAVFVIEKLAAAPRRRVMPSAKERAEHQVAEKAAVEGLVEKVKATVLDTVLPGGKLLRFATGAEVAELGAGYARIAAKVGPDCFVGEVLCEKDAAALLMSA
jgi:hypothetical protein